MTADLTGSNDRRESFVTFSRQISDDGDGCDGIYVEPEASISLSTGDDSDDGGEGVEHEERAAGR
jgi:hypothetical protein